MQNNQVLNPRRVQVIVKIKPPSQDELYSASTKAQMGNRTGRAPSPSAASVRRAIPMKTSLLKEFPVSFFSFDSPGAKKIFYFQNPIPKKLLDESIKNETDIENLRQTVFSSSKSFELDRAFSINHNNQVVYLEKIKPLIYELFQGQSSTVFLYGPTQSGKNYLLRGEEGREKGLSIHALEELFKLIDLSQQSQDRLSENKSYRVYCSILCIYQDIFWDLIQRTSRPFERKNSNEHDIDEEQFPQNHELISNTEDFKNLFRKSIIELKALATKYKIPSLNLESSLVISFALVKLAENKMQSEEIEQESFISFVKLPDVDLCQSSDEIKLLFQNIKDSLVQITRNSQGEGYVNPIRYKREKLLENIPALQVDNPFVSFICCLPASAQSSRFAPESLKFTSQLFSDISIKATDNRWDAGEDDIPIGKISRHQAESLGAEPKSRISKEEINQYRKFKLSSKRTLEDDTIQKEGELHKETEAEKDNEDENEQERNIRTLEKSIDDLKEEISNKLEEALQKESKLPEIDPTQARENQQFAHQSENIEKLKQTFEQKEKLELETHQALKAKIQQLKGKNKSLHEEVIRLNYLIKERDDIIAHYETEISLSQKQLTASNKKLLNQQIKEESMRGFKIDLNDEVERLRRKLESRKVKYEENMDKLIAEHRKALEALSNLSQENENLQKKYVRERGVNNQEEERFADLCIEMKKLKEEMAKKDQILNEWRVNGELQNQVIDDMKRKLHEEKSLNKVFTDEHAHLAVRIDNLKKELARAETDGEILSRKHAAEKEILADDKLLEISKSQQKQRKTRQKLKKAQETINQLEQELVFANQDRERYKNTEESLLEARDQMSKMLKDIELLQSKNDQSQKERLEDKQKDLETIKSLQNEVARFSEEINQLKNQVSSLSSENQELIEEQGQRAILLDKYESQLEYLQTHQIEEIDSMHLKIRDFIEQISILRLENQQKNDLANKLVHKLAMTEKERDEYVQYYSDLKKENKTLKKNFRQIDAKMKHLIDLNSIKNRNQQDEDVDDQKENLDQTNQNIQQKIWKVASKDYSIDSDK